MFLLNSIVLFRQEGFHFVSVQDLGTSCFAAFLNVSSISSKPQVRGSGTPRGFEGGSGSDFVCRVLGDWVSPATCLDCYISHLCLRPHEFAGQQGKELQQI